MGARTNSERTARKNRDPSVKGLQFSSRVRPRTLFNSAQCTFRSSLGWLLRPRHPGMFTITSQAAKTEHFPETRSLPSLRNVPLATLDITVA